MAETNTLARHSSANQQRLLIQTGRREPDLAFRASSCPLPQGKERKRLEQVSGEIIERFEQLAAIITEAMRYGPDARLEARYAELRGWMKSYYPEVSSVAGAFVPKINWTRGNPLHRYEPDVCESLFERSTLEETLRADDGGLYEQIQIVRSGLLELCGCLRAEVC
jgi:hypothetical protein